MSEFLKNLQKAVDEGEFNSEAAKKINELNELADKKISSSTPDFDLEKMVNKRVEDVGKRVGNEEDVEEINSEYEEKMELLKREDERNKDIAELMDLSKKLDEITEEIKNQEAKYVEDKEILRLIENIKSNNIKFYKQDIE